MSWRRMDKTNVLVLTKTSWRRLEDVFWRRMIHKNILVFIKTSWTRLEHVFRRRRQNTSSRCLHQDECLLGFNVKFWNYSYLSNHVEFSTWPKIETKILKSWKRKDILKWNKKHFSSFSMGYQLPKIVSDLTLRL